MNDDQGELFHVPGPEPEQDGPVLSPGQRRTARQAQAVRNGVHPLALVFGWPRMHPDADRTATTEHAAGRPYTCGTCRWRQVLRWHDRTYPKCVHPDSIGADHYETDGPLRLSHSAATDVRAWWPACVDYDAGDPRMSPDAHRNIP